MENIQQLIQSAQEEIKTATDLVAVENLRVKYLGKKGLITALLKQLGSMSPDERKQMGPIINGAKQELQQLINKTNQALTTAQLAASLAKESIDITLPGRKQTVGTLHPITKVRQRLEELFVSMGFDIATGPEIEDEFYNFEALNIPAHHPARTTIDTFYLKDIPYLLRTHTSPVQIRTMQKQGVPIKTIAPGRVYRKDSDATHVPMFHQLEGLVVDEGVTFSDLKGILNNLLESFFERKVELRFRPSYFPFTEPSAEVDLQCTLCNGKGCRVCSDTGWIEILGCGMVHPNVLQAVNVDSERYTGFAFGLGIDRFAMFRYGINDLRMMFDNDLAFLEQFY
ncbi:MAG: phenylalanine--tRNA ligase subunit alpha [Gammaproteobacteria bacterium]|nr:phenylalanine--tRNA ligase subunit alpha [Gammaproteobacteria bacterium]